jgi:hypothetical protein
MSDESLAIGEFCGMLQKIHGKEVFTATEVTAMIDKKLGRYPVFVIQYPDGTFKTSGWSATKILARARIYKVRHHAERHAKYKNGTVVPITLSV